MGRPRNDATQTTETPTVEEQQPVQPKVDLDSVVKSGGKPVVQYGTKEEKERGDKLYKCRVTNTMIGRGEGKDSVSVNGYTKEFPLGAETSLHGFQIDVLRGCKYKAPEMKEVDGQLKMVGYREHNVYAVDVEF